MMRSREIQERAILGLASDEKYFIGLSPLDDKSPMISILGSCSHAARTMPRYLEALNQDYLTLIIAIRIFIMRNTTAHYVLVSKEQDESYRPG